MLTVPCWLHQWVVVVVEVMEVELAPGVLASTIRPPRLFVFGFPLLTTFFRSSSFSFSFFFWAFSAAVAAAFASVFALVSFFFSLAFAFSLSFSP